MEDDGLFRQEALRRFREGGTRGQVLRLAPGWTTGAVAALLVIVTAIGLWAARATVETRTRVPAEVVSNDDRGLRIVLHGPGHGLDRPRPLVFYPASGGPGIPIGRGATWDDRSPEVAVIVASPAPSSLLPGTKGKVEVVTGRLRLLDVLRPGRG